MADFSIDLLLSGKRIKYAYWAALRVLGDGYWHRASEVYDAMTTAGTQPITYVTARGVVRRLRQHGIFAMKKSQGGANHRMLRLVPKRDMGAVQLYILDRYRYRIGPPPERPVWLTDDMLNRRIT